MNACYEKENVEHVECGGVEPLVRGGGHRRVGIGPPRRRGAVGVLERRGGAGYGTATASRRSSP